MRPLLLGVLLALSGCHTFNGDVKVFCSASTEAGWRPEDGFGKLAQWISERVHTDEFRGIFKAVAVAGDKEQFLRDLDAAVARAGISSCPTLDAIKGPGPR